MISIQLILNRYNKFSLQNLTQYIQYLDYLKQKLIVQIGSKYKNNPIRRNTLIMQQERINLFLLILNIIALANFTYPPHSLSLLLYAALTFLKIPFSIKLKMRLVSLLSLIASFVMSPFISQFLSICALGLAVNTAYQIDLTETSSAINTALGIAQIVSYWGQSYLQKSTIDRDIVILIFTLPNLFLSNNCQKTKSKALYLINPFLDLSWQYSLGFIIGIYTASLTAMEKHIKFLLISLILLLQFKIDLIILISILNFFRGILVYTEHIHSSEIYFLMGYLVTKILFQDYLINVMFIGYLVIGVILWQQSRHKKLNHKIKKDQNFDTQELQNPLNQFQNRQET